TRTWEEMAGRDAEPPVQEVERGFALLNQRWQALQRVTASPGRIGQIARAALVLTLSSTKCSPEVAEKTSIDTDRPSSSHATKTAQAVPGVPAVALVTRADQR
ncbi:MAG: hypothetical protein WAN00_24315, partial [Trebonia sp.]